MNENMDCASEERFERSPIESKIARDTGIFPDDLNEETLAEWQLAEIRGLLRYLPRSRHYREKLAGVDPEEIKTLRDFENLPLTSEEDLAGHENDFLCLSPGDVARMVTVPTTGTTGGSKRLAFTGSDIARSMDFITVAYTTFMRAGDRHMVMMSGGTQGSIGDVVKLSMDRIGAETYIYGPVSDIKDAYDTICKWKPDVITGIPVQMAALARYSERKGTPLKVREVLLSADDVPDAVCERLRKVWGAVVFRHFGMTELCIAGGCECCADRGYHLRHSDHYFEVLDPDGEGYGEIAVTTFHHEAMPLLRYRTGDFGRIDRSVCGCGSRLPRLIGPRGRLSNCRDFGHGKVFIRDIEEVIFSDPAVIDFECETGVSEEAGYHLNLLLKHFPGDKPDLSAVKSALDGISGLGGVETVITLQEMNHFEKQYNSKKRMR